MKTRIIVAALCVPLLFVILFFLPPAATAVIISCIAAVASYELLRAVGPCERKRFYVYAAVPAALIPLAYLLGPGDVIYRAVLLLLLAVLFGDAVLSFTTEKRCPLTHPTAALFGGAVIPYLLSSIVSLRLFRNGCFYVLIPFIIAFVTDGGAYFTGVFFGKRHPFPNVSPKKTAEGCIGGIVVGIASMVLYGAILRLAADMRVSFWAMALYGFVAGVFTELGDLAFSLVKREFSVKDYGDLIPGHGGVLDRFDSMIFAAPVIYFLVGLAPAF